MCMCIWPACTRYIPGAKDSLECSHRQLKGAMGELGVEMRPPEEHKPLSHLFSTPLNTHTQTDRHIHTHTQRERHIHTHTHRQTYTHTHTDIHTQTYTHTDTHTHTHTTPISIFLIAIRTG